MQVPAARLGVLVALAVVLLLAGAAGSTLAATGTADAGPESSPATTSTADTLAHPAGAPAVGAATQTDEAGTGLDCAAASPPDHADPDGGTSDVIGWVDGYWYDEPLGFETEDGLEAGERERLVARTAARVEALRCLSFEELPPVEVQTREAFAEEIEADYEAEAERMGELMNAEAAAMLLIGRDRDWADVQTEVLTGGVGAYYDPGEERITMIVEESGDRPYEQILGHELVHALQDQQFDLDRFDASLRSEFDAERGLIEGDATLVQRAYASRCDDGAWGDSCVQPAEPPDVDFPDDLGVYLLFQGPYLYGPPYVEAARQRGGWDAVDARYDDPPEHSATLIAPEEYGNASVEVPTVENRSAGDWERVGASGRPDHDVVGRAALTAMLVAPALEPDTNGSVISQLGMADPATGRLSDYDQPETSGWRGDALHAYSDGDRLASVWALEWVDGEQARQFADAYVELLELRGAEAVDGREDAYRLDADTGFDAAVEVRVDAARVTVVQAPTADDLDDVHQPASDGIVPGFGTVAAVVALLTAALLIARGRRRDPRR